MKLLLHTCCAPCLIYPLEVLQKKGFTVTAFFHNPNIHPHAEYLQRKRAVEALARPNEVALICGEYAPEEFFRATNLKERAPERCLACWSLRLRAAGRLAKEQGFDYFSTTLLVSPYQDQDAIRKIGTEIYQELGVGFYYEDFRPGFRRAHDLAKAKGIYCQRYCGCLYSEKERWNSSAKH